MKNEIEIDGKTYVLKSSIKSNTLVEKDKKGLTYCVIRTYSAGVFAGWVDRAIQGKELTVYSGRRLWKWKAKKGIDCASIAEHGVDVDDCKFSEIREEFDLKEVIELQPCTVISKESIESVEAELND